MPRRNTNPKLPEYHIPYLEISSEETDLNPARPYQYCRGCRLHKVIKHFKKIPVSQRTYGKSRTNLHGIPIYRKRIFSLRCFDCEDKDRERARENYRKAMVYRKFSAELTKKNTPQAMLHLIEHFALSSGKTIDGISKEMGDLYRDSDLRPSFRVRIACTILYAHSIVEAALITKIARGKSPEQHIRGFHRQGKLVPILRKMFVEEILTLDDIDPWDY